jgi:tRNA-specific 2-thiouridylase
MNKKAIGLFSGGLDSCLAVKLIFDQGFDVVCLSFDLWKFPDTTSVEHPLREKAEAFGAEFKAIDLSLEFPAVLAAPRWHYGSSVNPCIDCKLLMLRKAAEEMRKENAVLVFTGEVLGQRPMTQTKRMMNMLEKQSDLKGRLLRPLCAKLFPLTIPETEGIVDREKLLDIQGRGRRRQMELAKEYGLNDYPTPAGGCVLTEKEYGARFLDMLKNRGKPPDAESLEILKYGRHFRLSPDAKLVVGRDEKDNARLEGFKKGRIVFRTVDKVGPLALLEGKPGPAEIETAARITARYSKEKYSESVRIDIIRNDNITQVTAEPLPDSEIENFRIYFNRKELKQMVSERIRQKSESVPGK